MNKLNIGSLIKAEMKRQNVSATKMAKLLHVHRQTVYDMLGRSNIDIERLHEVSCILHKDFFLMLANSVRTQASDWCELMVSENQIVITKKICKK
ncbi:MAG: helix-turn-helix domain-containing protein [Bacteroidales bacterium]|nr:helix-turn-helix domain-containing protein [Bacteroidales bacterium]